jgi:hypothetical protein
MILKRQAATLVAMTFLWLVGPASAQEWQPLGSTTHEPRVERSVIDVGAQEGRFGAIRLDVKRADAEILDLKVVYGNNAVEDIKVRQTFKAGSSSRAIDLKGQDRVIKQIVVTYFARGPVQLAFFGIPSRAAVKWENLGCRDVGFLVDRDVIRVGRKEGAFIRLRLRARGNRIEIFDLVTYYGNGERDDIRVRAVIPDGGQSGPLDLRGKARGIDRIEMIYRTQPNFKGRAQICVDGLQRS